MKISAGLGLSVHQTAWRIFIIGIFFDNFSRHDGLFNLSAINRSADHFLYGMIGIAILSISYYTL